MKISIIGCGVIGSAFAKYLAKSHTVTLYDLNPDKSKSLASEISAEIANNPEEALRQAEVIVLAIKPQTLIDAAHGLGPLLKKHHLLISVLMGTSLENLQEFFQEPTIFRVMPNLSIRHQKGVLGIVSHPEMSLQHKQLLEDLFEGMGLIHWTKEEKIDALTALTASSPAYFFIIIESMIDAAVYLGFTAQDARKLVIQTFEGALDTLKESNKSTTELKWEVTSPGGNSIGGIVELERQGLRSVIIQTVLAGFKNIKIKH